MNEINGSFQVRHVPADVAAIVHAIADRTGYSVADVVAYFLREGLRAVPNPAPWNIDEQPAHVAKVRP